RALLHDAAHRQGAVGADLPRVARGRARAHGVFERPRAGLQPARRGRSRADGGPVPGGGVQRRGGGDDGGREHPAPRGGGGLVSRRMQGIGAHSADFVWRAGGAIAVATANGGVAEVIALSYGERGESGELWKQEGQTVENVKKIRHAEADAAAAHL